VAIEKKDGLGMLPVMADAVAPRIGIMQYRLPHTKYLLLI
jgi:hypothetical protein